MLPRHHSKEGPAYHAGSIPLLQTLSAAALRDPTTMTRKAHAMRAALAAARAAVPPPPVTSAHDIPGKGAAGPLCRAGSPQRKEKMPTVVFFHGGAGSPAIRNPLTGRRRPAGDRDRRRVISVDYRRPPDVRFPGRVRDALAAVKDVVERIAESAGCRARRRGGEGGWAIWLQRSRSPAVRPASSSPPIGWSIRHRRRRQFTRTPRRNVAVSLARGKCRRPIFCRAR